MRMIYLDGRYFKVNPHIITALTPGVFKAKGVFETMLGIDGHVLGLDLHMKRLRQGLRILKITPPAIDRSIFKDLLGADQRSCARLRMMVWKEGKQVHVMASALPYKIPVKEKYRVCLIKTDRPANSRMSNVKSLDYAFFAKAFAKAQAQGFDEALLLNRQGFIFEASRANIFWVEGRVLYTPPLSSGCLNGIMRQQVIKQAKELKIIVKERNLTPLTLKKADTAFLTNSLFGTKPIDTAMIKKISARV